MIEIFCNLSSFKGCATHRFNAFSPIQPVMRMTHPFIKHKSQNFSVKYDM